MNQILFTNSTATLVVIGKDGTEYRVSLDMVDGIRLKRLRANWSVQDERRSDVYFRASVKGKSILLHRYVLKAESGVCVDHIDGNQLNNIRSNLRIVTKAQNCQNSNKVWGAVPYRGVSFNKKTNRYKAALQVDGRSVYVGTFKTAEEAIAAECKAILEIAK